MKKRNFLFKFILFSLLFNIAGPLFANDNSQSEKKEEIPQVLQDIRRFEIITLGALPFVMLDSSLVYSGIRYFSNGMSNQYVPGFNPVLTKEEQKGVVLTSVGICLGIGLTDLIVNIVKRSSKKNKSLSKDDSVVISPISEDPDAIKLDKPKNLNNDTKSELEPEIDEIFEITEDTN